MTERRVFLVRAACRAHWNVWMYHRSALVKRVSHAGWVNAGSCGLAPFSFQGRSGQGPPGVGGQFRTRFCQPPTRCSLMQSTRRSPWSPMVNEVATFIVEHLDAGENGGYEVDSVRSVTANLILDLKCREEAKCDGIVRRRAALPISPATSRRAKRLPRVKFRLAPS